jgi:hypothetical protein
MFATLIVGANSSARGRINPPLPQPLAPIQNQSVSSRLAYRQDFTFVASLSQIFAVVTLKIPSGAGAHHLCLHATCSSGQRHLDKSASRCGWRYLNSASLHIFKMKLDSFFK